MITFKYRALPAAGYRVLAALDLGADAAALRGGARFFRPRWARSLEQLFLAADGRERIAIQLAPLAYDDAETLFADPRCARSELWQRFAAAILEVLPKEKASTELVAAARDKLTSPLQTLQELLWPNNPSPPLEILHAAALGKSGRGLLGRKKQRIAVSLSQPRDHVLCQIFHELVHAVSDGQIDRDNRDHDTRRGNDTLHLALEQHAVEFGQQLLESGAPELLPAYRAWRRVWI